MVRALIIPSESTAGFCRNPENQSSLMPSFRPPIGIPYLCLDQDSRRAFQRDSKLAAGRFLSPPPPSRLPPLAYLNAGRFMILHYRSTNYNPQIAFGVYSAAAPSAHTRIREPRRASLVVNANTMHSPSHAMWCVRSLNTCPQKRSCITCLRNLIY